MERQKFEDSWKDAFHKAESSPSENVWTNIELELEKAKGIQLQRRLLFYQLLTAASVLFIIGLGIGIYLLSDGTSNATQDQLAVQQTETEGSLNKNLTPKSSSESNQTRETSPDNSTAVITGNEKNTSIEEDLVKVNKNQIVQPSISNPAVSEPQSFVYSKGQSETLQPEKDDRVFYASALKERKLPALVENRKIELMPLKSEKEADPVALMLARLNQRENEIREEKKKDGANKNETLWTSVGFAAGTFNTINSGSTVNSGSPTAAPIVQFDAVAVGSETKTSIADKQAKAPGIAYSAGVSIGTKLSRRWVLQGGVNYLTQSSDYTAQNVVSSADFTRFRPASINELEKMAEGDAPDPDKLVTTAPYNVNNNLRYLSIPLQAGYLLINRDFGLQLNAGIATDLFLQNTMIADGQNLDKSTQDIGDDSPYRSVNLSGLVGTELSYRFAKHYRVALNPGVRYPLNTIYRSELGVEASPLTVDIGLRFRYIFH